MSTYTNVTYLTKFFQTPYGSKATLHKLSGNTSTLINQKCRVTGTVKNLQLFLYALLHSMSRYHFLAVKVSLYIHFTGKSRNFGKYEQSKSENKDIYFSPSCPHLLSIKLLLLYKPKISTSQEFNLSPPTYAL